MGTQLLLSELAGRPCLLVRDLIGRPDDIETLEKRMGEGFLEPKLPWLIDNQNCATIPGTRDVQRLTRFFERHEGEIADSRIAVVVPGVADYGMGRVLQARTDPLLVRVRPFRSMEEAVRWIFQAGS